MSAASGIGRDPGEVCLGADAFGEVRNGRTHEGEHEKAQADATDAALIAAYLKASEDLQPWEPASQALQDLQALVRRQQRGA